MNNGRPNLEGLFNGSAAVEPPLTWLNGQRTPSERSPFPEQTPLRRTVTATERPAARRPTPPRISEPLVLDPTGLFDPVAIAERYFAMLQALLDVQREFGIRLAQQIAALPPMNRPGR